MGGKGRSKDGTSEACEGGKTMEGKADRRMHASLFSFKNLVGETQHHIIWSSIILININNNNKKLLKCTILNIILYHINT